jgi:hypothetical protein
MMTSLHPLSLARPLKNLLLFPQIKQTGCVGERVETSPWFYHEGYEDKEYSKERTQGRKRKEDSMGAVSAILDHRPIGY